MRKRHRTTIGSPVADVVIRRGPYALRPTLRRRLTKPGGGPPRWARRWARRSPTSRGSRVETDVRRTHSRSHASVARSKNQGSGRRYVGHPQEPPQGSLRNHLGPSRDQALHQGGPRGVTNALGRSAQEGDLTRIGAGPTLRDHRRRGETVPDLSGPTHGVVVSGLQRDAGGKPGRLLTWVSKGPIVGRIWYSVCSKAPAAPTAGGPRHRTGSGAGGPDRRL